MPWKEHPPGTWARPMCNSERFLRIASKRFTSIKKEHLGLNIIAKLDFNGASQTDVVNRMRRAWSWIRYKHPFIAVRIHPRVDYFLYETPTKQQLETWLDLTFQVHSLPANSGDFLLDAPEIDYSTLHYFPSNSEILIRIHRCCIDTVGATSLLNQLLTHFVSKKIGPPSSSFGLGHVKLPPSHVEAGGILIVELYSIDDEAKREYQCLTKLLPSVALLPPGLRSIPGGTKVVRVSTPSWTLVHLASSAEHRGIGLAAAVQAAIMIATRECAVSRLVRRNFTTVTFIDHRKNLREPYNDANLWPMGMWAIGKPISLPPGGFWELARPLHHMFINTMATKGTRLLTYDEFYRHMTDCPSYWVTKGARFASPPQLDSLGSIGGRGRGYMKTQYTRQKITEWDAAANHWKPITVDVLEVEPVMESMNAMINVFEWSFNGVWYLKACYNNHYYTKDAVQKFLLRVKEIVLWNLEVSETRLEHMHLVLDEMRSLMEGVDEPKEVQLGALAQMEDLKELADQGECVVGATKLIELEEAKAAMEAESDTTLEK